MKQIVYKFDVLQGHSLEGEAQKVNLVDVSMPYSEKNLAVAKKEAYMGQYTIEDDGQPEPVELPTQLDLIEAQVAYTAMMTDTLLEV